MKKSRKTNDCNKLINSLKKDKKNQAGGGNEKDHSIFENGNQNIKENIK